MIKMGSVCLLIFLIFNCSLTYEGVHDPSAVIKGLSTFNAKETVQLTCVLSFGTFTRWLGKDNRTLSPLQNSRVSIDKRTENNATVVGSLSIVNVSVDDSGLYTCLGKSVNELQMIATKEVIVKAVFSPKIISLSNITVHYRHNNKTDVQLTCHMTGNPLPRVTWKRNGSRLSILKEEESCKSIVRGYYLKKTTQGIGNVLLICNAEYRHTGWYGCEAENSEGQDLRRAYIDVLTAPNIEGSPYLFKYMPIGNSINLKCHATGNPIPTVVLSKQLTNGLMVSPWKGQGFVSVKIKELSKSDYGNYTCTARNSEGTDIMVIDVRELVSPKSVRYSENSTIMIATTVGGSIGLIFVITILVCCLVNRRQMKQLDEYKAIKYLRKGEDYKLDPGRTIHEQCEELPYDPDWEFPIKRLILQGVIGSGTFGQVIKAEAIGILSFSARDKTSDAFRRRSRLRKRLSSNRIHQNSAGEDYTRTVVAVKTLKEEASENDYKDLATELKVMIHLGEHTNIVNLLGACTKTKQLMVIMEFAPHGNLLNFLRSRREVYEATWQKTDNKPDAEFTLGDLVMYSYQIARGMDFLSSKKCVHRDLAARNVLVGDDYVMKIADFGLARDIYKTDIYVKETTGLLPVKWMAPESLFDRVYTQKTDVWSFGVLLWEIQTLGGTPYPGVSVEQLMDYLSEGRRMRQPSDCPPEIYAIMRDCWLQKPAERPTFAELVRRIERIVEKKISGQEAENSYISVFMDEDLHRIYYLEPKDTVSGTNTSQNVPESITEEEIQKSPIPPVPCLSLVNLYQSPNDDNSPYYCDPVDNYGTRYVQNPKNPKRSSKKKKARFDYSSIQSHNPTRPLARSDQSDELNEKRISEYSTGMESGIDMDEPYPSDYSSLGRRDGNCLNNHSSERPDGNHNIDHSFGRLDGNLLNDHSLGRQNKHRYYVPDDAEGVSFLDSSIVKEKTKETIL